MVRQLVFEDNVRWVARLRLPVLKSESGNRAVLDSLDTMKVEVASMKFLRSHSSIPVPEVHSHSLDTNNDIGAPYILMDYVHGTVATELQDAKECPHGLFGSTDQDRKFKQQMAQIQVQLSSFVFDQIGSLYQDESTGDFHIGPETETGKGPWTSAMAYYEDLADHALTVCAQDAEEDVTAAPSFANPALFKHLIPHYTRRNEQTSKILPHQPGLRRS